PLRLLCVANLMERKGLDVLFAALAGLHGEWRLTLVGSPDHEPKTASALGAQAKQLGIADRINRVGTVASDRLTELYGAADLFVFPSRYEGFGMVLTEAAAHGLPIVTTNGGAIPDTVRGLTAEVVPVDDAPAFCACVQRYLDDPDYRTRRRTEANETASRLTRWEQAVARFRDAIQEGTTS
ncbi:MAG: glycosyltransferase, partial [Spirochaetaceae bacterium]